jgi:hypothetical protein
VLRSPRETAREVSGGRFGFRSGREECGSHRASRYLSCREAGSACPIRTHARVFYLFISYPRRGPGEADVVERLLLRLQHDVFRDDKDFPPGAPLPEEIKAKIHQCTVFIALWCQEYACSPWCFDELQEALPLAEKKHLQLWILCLDDTRMVPKNARDLLAFPVNGRKELEGAILDLLSGQRQAGYSDRNSNDDPRPVHRFESRAQDS